MSTKKKIERHSFVDENGQRWLQCKYCYDYKEVEPEIGAITCGNCVVKIDMIKFPGTIKKQKVSSGRPAGWHFMNEYVDKDGNVFHKGKEQPDLKGTLPPTKVKPRKKKKKLSADDKLKRDLDNWKKRKRARRGK
tara:strand:- start:102 stop:506 length:405 start_codon:yes stop_codon:yes gene_type:complete